jgi:hypothetical protein
MQKTTMAEGIVDILPHLAAISFKSLQFQRLSVPYLPEHMQFVAPEEIIQTEFRPSHHHSHLVPIVKHLYNILTISTII